MVIQPPQDIPKQLETDRLLIRCPQPGDGTAVYEAITHSSAHLAPWLSWVNFPDLSRKRIVASMKRNRERYIVGDYLEMLIFLKETGALIGGSGLHDPVWNVPKFKIGYWQHIDYGGNGYMTEAVNGIAQFAFTQLGAKRLQLECFPHNDRSIGVAQRCGFQLEARLANYRRHHQTNALHDWLIFARFPDG